MDRERIEEAGWWMDELGINGTEFKFNGLQMRSGKKKDEGGRRI